MRQIGTQIQQNTKSVSKNNSVVKVSVHSDYLLWFSIFLLLACGLVMVYSSSFIFAQDRMKDGFYFFKKHLFSIMLGSGFFLLGFKMSLELLRKGAYAFLALSTVLLAFTFLPFFSKQAGGAQRWIELFGFSFQPAEFAKFAVILYLARQVERKISFQKNIVSGVLTYFIGCIPIYILLMNQPDFGTAALILMTTFVVLFGSGVKIRYLLGLFLGFIPVIVYFIYSKPYRLNRLLIFFDPWVDPTAKGFQTIQSLLAFYSGKWLGVGFGNSKEKLFYLPEAHNDFIFAVIGEESGLLGVFFITALFLIIGIRGLKIVQKQKNGFYKALALGITSIVSLQAYFNMGVVLGLLPTKGIPLPLISYGGTCLVVTLFMLGVLVQLSEKNSL